MSSHTYCKTHREKRGMRGRGRIACAVAVLGAVACGGGHELERFAFAGSTLAVADYPPPAPELWTGAYDVGGDDVITAVVDAGSRVAKEVEAREARAEIAKQGQVDQDCGTKQCPRCRVAPQWPGKPASPVHHPLDEPVGPECAPCFKTAQKLVQVVRRDGERGTGHDYEKLLGKRAGGKKACAADAGHKARTTLVAWPADAATAYNVAALPRVAR